MTVILIASPFNIRTVRAFASICLGKKMKKNASDFVFVCRPWASELEKGSKYQKKQYDNLHCRLPKQRQTELVLRPSPLLLFFRSIYY